MIARLIRNLLPTVAVLFLTASSQAQTNKIGTIDLGDVFTNYWKTIQANIEVKERADEVTRTRQKMLDDYQTAQEEYQQLLERVNDEAISSSERERRKTAAERKLAEVKDIEESVRVYSQTSNDNLANLQMRRRDAILAEIREVIDARAKAGGYSLVIDSAALTVDRTHVILYTNRQNDLTREVLSNLNLTAPPGFLEEHANR